MLLTCHRNILYKQTPNFKYATPLKKGEEVKSNEIYFIFKFFFSDLKRTSGWDSWKEKWRKQKKKREKEKQTI